VTFDSHSFTAFAAAVSFCTLAMTAGAAEHAPSSAADYYDQARKSDSGLDKDIAGAMSGLLTDAKQGGEVLRTWAALKSGDKTALRQMFQLAKEGNSRAQNIVGYLLDNGEQVKRDSRAAFAYFSAASRDFPLARYNQAVLLFLGRGVPKDEAAAIELFKDSVKSAGVDLAAVRLALHYLGKEQRDEAWRWANEGANRGNITAYYLLGRMLYERGEYGEAFGWLNKAAQASEPNAPAILSAMFRDGRGMDHNQKMAASWLLIYAGLNRNTSGANATSIGSFRLSSQEELDATNFASNWLATHKNMKRPDYSVTILQVGNRQ